MVNAQNLTSPRPNIDRLFGMSDPRLSDQSLLRLLGGEQPFSVLGIPTPDTSLTLPPQPSRAQPGNTFLQDLLGSKLGDLQREEGEYGQAVANRQALGKQIMEGYMNPPQQVERKRVPRDTQLLTGGIGLLLRALGASHEATVGGVNTALAGMQQRLDEESERENTKRFNDFNSKMQALNFAYNDAILQTGLEGDQAKTLRTQIKDLQDQVDKQAERQNQVLQSMGKDVIEMSTKGELTPATLQAMVDLGSRLGVTLFEGDEFYGLYYKAQEDERNMTDAQRLLSNTKKVQYEREVQGLENDKIKTNISALEETSKALELELQQKTFVSEEERLKAVARKAVADADLAEQRAKFEPTEQNIKKQKAADDHRKAMASIANYYSLIGNRGSDGTSVPKAVREATDLAARVKKSRLTQEGSKARNQQGELNAQTVNEAYYSYELKMMYNNAPEDVRAQLKPVLEGAGIPVAPGKSVALTPDERAARDRIAFGK